MGLLPLQDPAAAADELRYIVTELGMCGAMIPGSGYRGALGDREYWPIYRAADELGCALAVHGGSYAGLGLDAMGIFAGAHALGHPYAVLNAFTSLTFNGVFDTFGNTRFGFLEAGVGWLLMALERFDGSHRAFVPFDPDGAYLRLRAGEDVSEHLIARLRGGQIFVGVEGEEAQLGYAVKTIGREPFVFSSDFPHEVNPAICAHEIEELLEHPDLDHEDKEAILHRNAERLYGLVPAPAYA
jgi:2,3-dihydroxybenzoate decarboxylase